MKSFFFNKLLQADGWKSNVSVEVDFDGKIVSIQEESKQGENLHIEGWALPGFQNAHSHAFQYAMAGLAEVHSSNQDSDSFWSWREAMYDLALRIEPEQLEAIAAMLYAEMVRQGYTNVAEFHYVHHDKNGQPYPRLAEMGARLVSAAQQAGINITLVPIFYQQGGFGKAPVEGQKRFISSTIEDYLKLLDASAMACADYAGANIAMGIHSMRGVEPTDIAKIAAEGPQDIPFHIHISEQLKEIEDSITYLGKRPVEWLLDNVDVNERFHLVHATHLTEQETAGIAKSGANVVLCPSTEGNLGDGIFPLNAFHKSNGNWSIGTDSHIGINPFEELRLLDYGQRLISHNRKTFAHANGDSGQFAINMATTAGRKAMNNFSEVFFEVGQPLNAAIIDHTSPLLANTTEKNILSTMLYTVDSSHQWGTIVNGELVCKNGNHKSYDRIRENFSNCLESLKNR